MDQEAEVEVEVEASILPPSSPHTVPAKRKRASKASTVPSAMDGEDAALPSKPKKKRAKTVKDSDVPAVHAVEIASLVDGQQDASGIAGDDKEAKVVTGGPKIRIKRPKQLVEVETTADMLLDELESEPPVPNANSEQVNEARTRQLSHDSWGTEPPNEQEDNRDADAGDVPPPQAEHSFSSTPIPAPTPFTLPPPPVVESASSKSKKPAPVGDVSFNQLRKNIMRNLMFKDSKSLPHANFGSPPSGSHGSTPPRATASAAERHPHLSPEVEYAQSSSRYTPARSQGDETERSYLGAGDSRAASEEPGRPRSASPMDTAENDIPRVSALNYQNFEHTRWEAPDWTPPQSEIDPYDNPELLGQYKTSFQPEPPKKKQTKKKRAIRPMASLDAGDLAGDGSIIGVDQEGTENGEGTAPVKKKKKSVKPLTVTTPTEDPNNGFGSWRRGLRKGQSRADAIAMFHEANPGVPLPPGWDFPGNAPEKPVLAKLLSFRKEPPPPPPAPKGDLLSYVTIEQIVPQEEDSLAETKQEIVFPSGPSRPVATAMRLDIANADETDFEKLGVEVREPLRDPEAIATQENVGHPVFRHYVGMQGLPVLKAIDPTKNLKEHDMACPRELKENMPGRSRRFAQEELSVMGIGGYQLKFRTWTGDTGKSSWRAMRDERVAEQQRAAEEAMINDPPVLGPEGTPMAGAEGTYDENGLFVPSAAPTKGKRGGLTKTGKQRKPWTKKTDKGDAGKRILDSLKRQGGSPSLMGTPDVGTAAVNSEVASSPIPMPDFDDTIISQADYSRPPSPMPGLSVAGDDVDAEMEDLL